MNENTIKAISKAIEDIMNGSVIRVQVNEHTSVYRAPSKEPGMYTVRVLIEVPEGNG